MTPWIDTGKLDAATLTILEGSKYTRAFILAILGAEDDALYQWQRGGSWLKSTLQHPPAEHPVDFWQQLQDPELWSDPEGWSEREARRFLAEQQQKQTG